MTGTTSLQAVQHVRRMRGGAQSHLMRGSDGGYWIVKFTNNPQHVRILANEFLASRIGFCLGLPMPQVSPIAVSDWLIENTPELHIECAGLKKPCRSGLQLASRYIADPATDAVFDYLPESLSKKIMNIEDFPRCLVLDKWTGNADSRQSIFFRARLKQWLPHSGSHGQRIGLVAHMVDHGFIFEGPHWKINDSPLTGLYFRPLVYQGVRGLDDFQPWLDRIVHFPEEVVDGAVKQIPPAWLDGEEQALGELLDRLLARTRKVPYLIESSRDGAQGRFPAWT